MEGREEGEQEPTTTTTGWRTEESVWLKQYARLKQCVKDFGVLNSETVECREAFLASSVQLLNVSVKGQNENTGKIERAVWKHGFYVTIHEYRVKNIVDGFGDYVEQAIAWYTQLLENVEGIMTSNPENQGGRMTMSRCYVCLGDLYRYKIQHGSFCRKDVNESKDAYVHAIQLRPGMGNSYNQLAVLFSLVDDPFRSLFYYIRSATADEPFPSADDNMSLFLHKTLQGTPRLKKQKGKNSMHDVERILGNTCLTVIAKLYLQIDIDTVLDVWKHGSHIMEEYLNRRLQRIRKSAGNLKPVFGKSRHSEEPMILQQIKQFQDPPHVLIMMVQSLLLLMQGKLEHAKCAENIRSTLTRTYGYIIVLDVTGRIASLVGRCCSLLRQTQHARCIDVLVSEVLVPLLMLVSWISKDWRIHNESSLRAFDQAPDFSCADKALKKFLRGMLSMAQAMSHVADNVAHDGGKLSRVSRTGMIHGCPLLETIMDYPLLVVKQRWEEEHGLPFSSRRPRKKAHGLHVGSWTVIHNVWTMLLDLSQQMQEGPVAAYLGERYDILRMKIHEVVTQQTKQSKQKGPPTHRHNDAECEEVEVEEVEEDIVYVARNPKRPLSRGPERMQEENVSLYDDDAMPQEYYNTHCLASEMAEGVLPDEDHVGPSDEYLLCHSIGSDFGNMLQYDHS